MEYLDWLEDELADLSLVHRSAFALACAERALPVYEEDAVVEPSIPKQTISFLYETISQMAEVTDFSERSSYLKAQLDDILEDEDVAGDSGLLNSIIAMMCALGSLEDPSIQSALTAATSVLDVIDNIDPEADEGVEEEIEWQKSALALVKGWEEPKEIHSMFQSQSSPEWFQRYMEDVYA